MAVAKRRKSKIVVDDSTYYWAVDHIPGDDFPTLVVVSPDKSLCFHYPVDEFTHGRFINHLNHLDLTPPIPPERSAETRNERNPAFNVTPRFVSELIKWCLSNQCLTTPGRSLRYPTLEEARFHEAWAEVAGMLKQKALPEFFCPDGISPSDPWAIADFLRNSEDDATA